MADPAPIRTRWVRRLKEPDPETGLALRIVPGEVRASMLAGAEDPVSAARLRESDCLGEARRYRAAAARLWTHGTMPMSSAKFQCLPEEAKKRYAQAAAMIEIARVWDEQAAAWAQLRRSLEGSNEDQ